MSSGHKRVENHLGALVAALLHRRGMQGVVSRVGLEEGEVYVIVTSEDGQVWRVKVEREGC